MSSRPEMSGVSGCLAERGVAARVADSSEDDITSYLKCSAKDVLGGWSFEVERSAKADWQSQ